MSVDDCFHIWHKTVTNFDIIFVEDLVVLMLLGKVLLVGSSWEIIYQCWWRFCCWMVGWTIYDFSFAFIRFIVSFCWRVLERVVIFGSLECSKVVWGYLLEYLSIYSMTDWIGVESVWGCLAGYLNGGENYWLQCQACASLCASLSSWCSLFCILLVCCKVVCVHCHMEDPTVTFVE